MFQSKPVQVEYLRMKGQGKAGGLPLPEFAMLTSRSLIKHDHDSLASGAVDSTEPEESESPVEVWSATLVDGCSKHLSLCDTSTLAGGLFKSHV
jgi:hypothetical protein